MNITQWTYLSRDIRCDTLSFLRQEFQVSTQSSKCDPSIPTETPAEQGGGYVTTRAQAAARQAGVQDTFRKPSQCQLNQGLIPQCTNTC